MTRMIEYDGIPCAVYTTENRGRPRRPGPPLRHGHLHRMAVAWPLPGAPPSPHCPVLRLPAGAGAGQFLPDGSEPARPGCRPPLQRPAASAAGALLRRRVAQAGGLLPPHGAGRPARPCAAGGVPLRRSKRVPGVCPELSAPPCLLPPFGRGPVTEPAY